MCGIAGAIDLRGTRRFQDERLLRMTVSGGERGSQREGTVGADSRIVDGGVGYQSLFFDATDSHGG